MTTQHGPLVCTQDNLVQTPYGLFITEVKRGEALSPRQIRFLANINFELDQSKRLHFTSTSEKKLLENIKFHGVDEFIASLKMIHDCALYNTGLSIDAKEKQALFNLKVLWEGLEEMGES